MKPFLDSTDVADDADALQARAAGDGYVFIRGLLSADAVEALRRSLIAIAREDGWVAADAPGGEPIAELDSFCLEPEPKYMKTMCRMYRLEAMHAIKHDDRLTGVIERVLGGPAVAHPRIIPRAIFPQQDAYTTPPHQDFVPIQGTVDTYTAWMPLSDLPPDMGGLQLAAGSHQGAVYDFVPDLGAGGMRITADFGDRWSYNPMQQGDVLIFHSLMVHQGVPNRSDRLRFSLDARYTRLSEPITPECTQPHTTPEMTWEHVYEDWPDTELKYYWKKLNLNFKEMDPIYYAKRDAMAIELAEQGDVRSRSVLQRIIARDPDPDKRRQAQKLLAQIDEAHPAYRR